MLRFIIVLTLLLVTTAAFAEHEDLTALKAEWSATRARTDALTPATTREQLKREPSEEDTALSDRYVAYLYKRNVNATRAAMPEPSRVKLDARSADQDATLFAIVKLENETEREFLSRLQRNVAEEQMMEEFAVSDMETVGTQKYELLRDPIEEDGDYLLRIRAAIVASLD